MVLCEKVTPLPHLTVRQIKNIFLLISSRRNILSDINNAEFTMLPVPQEKESLQVFLRVKPKTDHELKVFR